MEIPFKTVQSNTSTGRASHKGPEHGFNTTAILSKESQEFPLQIFKAKSSEIPTCDNTLSPQLPSSPEANRRPSVIDVGQSAIDLQVSDPMKPKLAAFGPLKGRKTRFLKNFIPALVSQSQDTIDTTRTSIYSHSRNELAPEARQSQTVALGIMDNMKKVEWSYGFKYKQKNIGIDYEPLPVFTDIKSIDLSSPGSEVLPYHKQRFVPLFHSHSIDLFSDLAKKCLIEDVDPELAWKAYKAFPSDEQIENHLRKLDKDSEHYARILLVRMRNIRKALLDELIQDSKRRKLESPNTLEISSRTFKIISVTLDNLDAAYHHILQTELADSENYVEECESLLHLQPVKTYKEFGWADHKIRKSLGKRKISIRPAEAFYNYKKSNTAKRAEKHKLMQNRGYLLRKLQNEAETPSEKADAVIEDINNTEVSSTVPAQENTVSEEKVISETINSEPSLSDKSVKSEEKKDFVMIRSTSIHTAKMDSEEITQDTEKAIVEDSTPSSNVGRSKRNLTSKKPQPTKPKPSMKKVKAPMERIRKPEKTKGQGPDKELSQFTLKSSRSFSGTPSTITFFKSSRSFSGVPSSKESDVMVEKKSILDSLREETGLPPIVSQIPAQMPESSEPKISEERLSSAHKNETESDNLDENVPKDIKKMDPEKSDQITDPISPILRLHSMSKKPGAVTGFSWKKAPSPEMSRASTMVKSESKVGPLLFEHGDSVEKPEKRRKRLFSNQKSSDNHRVAREKENQEKLREAKLTSFIKSLIKDATVLDEGTRKRFSHLSKGIFGKSGKIGMERLASALKSVNVHITENEIDYIKGVLELFDDAIVDQTEFCLVAAIAERMTMLEGKMRKSFFETDFKKLDGQVKHYRNLYGVYAGQNGTGRLTKDDILIILQATGLENRFFARIIEALGWQTKETIEFLDFISFIPFFARIHSSIIENVMKNEMNLEDLLQNLNLNKTQ